MAKLKNVGPLGSVTIMLLILTGCSGPAEAPPPGPVPAEPIATDMTSVSPPQQSADRGRRLYLRCAACHSVSAADGHKVGPHLEGIVGREVGSSPGYNYSTGLRESSDTWTEERLRQFMREPRSLYPATSMAFAGIQREEDLDALIAYLQTF